MGKMDQGVGGVEWVIAEEGGVVGLFLGAASLTGRRASDQFVCPCALFCKRFHTLWT